MDSFFRFLTVVLFGAVVLLLLSQIQQDRTIADLEHRVTELNCVHQMYEDGSAEHLDAEIAFKCLERELGWGKPGWDFPGDR